MLLTACTLQPTSPAIDPVKGLLQTEITTDQFVDLPLPSQLQQVINVSQLITAQWGEDNKQQLLMQLQVDEQQIVLAGFSAWGAPLLSLTYLSDEEGNKIETHVMNGLSDSLPKPEQVLFNLMLAIWPESAWRIPLDKIGWKLQEIGLQRLLVDESGNVVITIDYQNKPYLDGKITFKHQLLNYTIMIETKS